MAQGGTTRRGRGAETHSYPMGETLAGDTSSSHVSLRFSFIITKEQEPRLFQDFPHGMSPLLVHQSSGSALVCQNKMPVSE